MRVALVAAALVVIYLAGHGLLVLAGGGTYDSAGERAVYGLTQLVVAAGIAAGLLVSSRRQRVGMLLIAGSVAALSARWYWFLVVTIPVGIGLVWLAYLRGRAAAVRALSLCGSTTPSSSGGALRGDRPDEMPAMIVD